MFYLPNTKVQLSHDSLVAPGAVFTSEGQAAVRAAGNTAAGVQPSAGTAGEVFAGFVIAGGSSAPFAEPYFNKIEEFVVPSTGSVTLARSPITGQYSVYNKATGAAVTGTTLTDNVISGLTAGMSIKVVYKFALTVIERQALQGNVEPGGYAGAQVGQIGTIVKGIVYTSNFDTSKNWAAATAVKLAANGQLTDQSGSGVTIPAFVIALPSVEIPYLGLEFDIQ